MPVAYLFGSSEVVILQYRDGVGAVERERVLVGQAVPQRFEVDGGGDIAFVPEQGDHLAKDPNRTTISRRLDDEGAERRAEGLRIGPVVAHEHRERLRGV